MAFVPSEIYLSETNQRMGRFIVKDFKREDRIYEERLPNAKNLDLDDWLHFESNRYGWVNARVVRIITMPFVQDEYELEFETDDGMLVREFEEGRNLF